MFTHLRFRQLCFFFPAPPNFFLSLQLQLQPPQSVAMQPLHEPHRLRLTPMKLINPGKVLANVLYLLQLSF